MKISVFIVMVGEPETQRNWVLLQVTHQYGIQLFTQFCTQVKTSLGWCLWPPEACLCPPEACLWASCITVDSNKKNVVDRGLN